LVLGCVTVANAGEEESESRLPDEPIPYKSDEDLPARARPLLELGEPFLASGPIGKGFTLPTGAVWQPRLWVFGTLRTALQSFDPGDGPQVSEWKSRLDLYANLQLTGTERLLIGIEPLHRNDRYTGQVFEPGEDEGFKNRLNARVRTLFFEGDLGELFPKLDVADGKALDYGFSVGRQRITFQDGLLINDTIDAAGLTRNSLRIPGVSWITNIRITALGSWNEIHRDDNIEDPDAELFALFTATDTRLSTVEFDLVYVRSDGDTGDLFAGAVGASQRIGEINTSLRLLGSAAIDEETAQSDDGALLFGEFSWTPHHTDNIAYVNAFWGIDNFTMPARDPEFGGPLGRAGLLFDRPRLGQYPAPLGERADESVGVAAGYQMFFAGNRRQLVVEVGGRLDHSDVDTDAGGIAARLQQAVGRRAILQLDGFVVGQDDQDAGYGLRTEILVKF
jgi:hypothetical protein